jgi:hypothetical protein
MLLGAYVVILNRCSWCSRAQRLLAGYVSNRGNAYPRWLNSLCFSGQACFEGLANGRPPMGHLEDRDPIETVSFHR